ncbi:hypothetical protein [Roseobacter sp. N2S]|nr:hypothetical protein [Roseobacter sp. N2S]MDR6266019.1 ABC-type proline/glycine betaine transport system permease subunit [Roseobacter sp. N2S]
MELPNALSQIMVGVNQCLMPAYTSGLYMVIIAAVIGTTPQWLEPHGGFI